MLAVPEKRENHCEGNKKVAQREECALQEKCFFAPSASGVFSEDKIKMSLSNKIQMVKGLQV